MQGDGSVEATRRRTLFQKAQEELEMQRTGVTGDFMPSNPPGMRQTRTGTNSSPKPPARPVAQKNADGGYTPGYIGEGKDRRYQTKDGQLYRNHFGPVMNQLGGIIPGLNKSYTNYYDGVADAAGTERRDGSTAKPKMASFGDDYAEQEKKLFAEAEKSRPSTGDMDKPPVRPSQPEVEEPISALNSGDERVNSNGVVQRGRNLSTIVDKGDNTPYLEGKGGLFDNVGLGTDVQINRGWASNQLPGTETALYGGRPVSDQLGEGEQNLVLSKDLDQDGGAVRNLEGMPLEAFQESQKSGESSGGQRNWMEKGPEDAKMARRRAFLDAPNSMAGMRAVDAQLGRVRSGNDFFYVNPKAGGEGESEFVKVSLADGRSHQNDQMSGQQLLDKYVTGVKETMNASDADSPSPAEFHPAMESEQAGEVLNSYTQNGFHPDMEEEQFKGINY